MIVHDEARRRRCERSRDKARYMHPTQIEIMKMNMPERTGSCNKLSDNWLVRTTPVGIRNSANMQRPRIGHRTHVTYVGHANRKFAPATLGSSWFPGYLARRKSNTIELRSLLDALPIHALFFILFNKKTSFVKISTFF